MQQTTLNKTVPQVVAHVILNMDYGGAEKLVVDLATTVSSAYFAPRVVCLDKIKGNTEQLDLAKVPVDLIQRRQAKFDVRVVLALTRYLRIHNVGLVHSHDLSSLLYAVCAGILANVPVVMTEHSRHYLDERWVRRMEKRILAWGTKVFVEVSPLLAREAVARDGIATRKIKVIENGVDIAAFKKACGDGFRRELGIGKDHILLGMVGRLETIKGPDHLFEAIASLVEKYPNLCLVYVGRGEMRSSLEAEVKRFGLEQSVFFAGVRSDIPEVMAALDVFVLPSLSEGLPFAMLEAMAAGRPVIASAVGQIPDILVDGDTGWLVPPGDYKALADKLAFVLDGLEQAKVVGAKGAALISARYSKADMIAAYEKVYSGVIEQRQDNGGA